MINKSVTIHFLKKKNNGFSLIELVVVVAILSILASIGIPSFNCFQRRSKAAAALAAIRQLQKECELTSLNTTNNSSSFTNTKLVGYENISTSSRVDCGTNTIELIPDSNNTNILPIYRYNNQTKELSFSFKGVTGVDLTKCLNLVCDTNLGNFITTNDQLISTNRNIFLSKIQENPDLIMESSYAEKDCSAYVLVKGSTWDQAQANAKALGGNLTTPNNKNENKFLIDQYTKMLESEDSNWNNGIRSGAWIGLNSDSEGNLSFADGEKLDSNFKSPYGDLQSEYPEEYRNKNTRSGYHLLMKDPSGHAQRHGGLNKWWREPVSGRAFYDIDERAYWGYNYGIAEVPLCKN